jgi:hypothetical protein
LENNHNQRECKKGIKRWENIFCTQSEHPLAWESVKYPQQVYLIWKRCHCSLAHTS